MQVEIKIPEHTIITADDQGVTIERLGFRNLANRGTLGTVRVPYAAIASVIFRKSTIFGGKFEIVTVSGPIHNGGLGGLDPAFAFTAYGSKLAIVFRNNKNHEMEALQDFIEEKVDDARSQIESNDVDEASHIDSADEIRKYRKLADDGIITEDEFNAKKKQLLNL